MAKIELQLANRGGVFDSTNLRTYSKTDWAPIYIVEEPNDATQLRLRHRAGNAADCDLCDRVKGGRLDPIEAGGITERMREKMLARGEVATDVVVVEGATKETLRLHGAAYAVTRVRTAMFNATISWQQIELD
jgi:hypothetical protein